MLLACLGLALLAGAVCTVNALSIVDEAARDGKAYPPWKAFGTEYTSLLGTCVVLPLAVLAERLATARGGLVRPLAILLGISLVYSLGHVAIMIGLREALWWARGEAYSFDFGRDWLYEYRKDVLGYILAVGVIAVARRWSGSPEQPSPASKPSACATLADGRRPVLIDCTDLIAVRGGGNYVELVLADGRRRLLRSTLGAAEVALAGFGFRRSHKSWLVRLDAIEAMERTGSGDYRLRLTSATEIPLSRRNSAMLEEVRNRLAARL